MTKRSKADFPNLQKKFTIKRRQELIDYDYVNKLNNEEKAWLDKFTSEYVNASFKKQEVVRDGNPYERHSPKNIHKKDLTKKSYTANNRRNVDIFATKNCIGGISSLSEEEMNDFMDKGTYAECNNFEDGLADFQAMMQDKELYKIEILEYLNKFNVKNKKEKKHKEEEIEYLKSIGLGWVFED